MENELEKYAGKEIRKDHKPGTREDPPFLRVIGDGAFSRVYLAEGRNGRLYACKVSRAVKMLEREAEIMSRIFHPLFPAYIGYEENGGTGRLFMEYIPGRNLGQAAQFRGGFSPGQTMRIAEELAEGLRYLHEMQPAILYRDLKPENIMVCENGHMKLIDLGCACYQDGQGGERAGTPGFAAPEQLEAAGIAGIYSDVYCLGRTIQRVLAGKKASSVLCTGAERICRRRLERMIEASVREDPGQRPQDMLSVLHILTGKRKREEGTICEKNIWESSYKNSCSLPLI